MDKIIKRLIAISCAASMFSFITLFNGTSGLHMHNLKMLTIGLSIFASTYTYVFIKNKLEDLW